MRGCDGQRDTEKGQRRAERKKDCHRNKEEGKDTIKLLDLNSIKVHKLST